MHRKDRGLAAEKPTGKGASKRAGLPKSSPLESASLSTPFSGPTSSELPTDLSALASILEAAMTSDTPAPRPEQARTSARTRVNSQLPTPNSQHPIPIPTPRRTWSSNRAQPRRTGEASQREAAAFDEVARSLAAAEACVPLLAQSTGLLRLAALDVVRAETARAGGLLQLLRFLRGDISLPMTAVSTSRRRSACGSGAGIGTAPAQHRADDAVERGRCDMRRGRNASRQHTAGSAADSPLRRSTACRARA